MVAYMLYITDAIVKRMNVTTWFILLVIIQVIIFEAYAMNTPGVLTISEQVRAWNSRIPLMPWIFTFLCGFLGGHFFW